jgi:hypothetical protein
VKSTSADHSYIGNNQPIPKQNAENNPNWKGGQIICNRYIFIRKLDHPKAFMSFPYFKRARLVMEEKLGRILEQNEEVHHINGIRDDDRIENLQLTTKNEHLKLRKKRKLITEEEIKNIIKDKVLSTRKLRLLIMKYLNCSEPTAENKIKEFNHIFIIEYGNYKNLYKLKVI